MASIVQTKTTSAGGYATSHNFTFDSNMTSGNHVVLVIYHGGAASISSVTDSNGNTYTEVHHGTGIYADGSMFVGEITTGGITTISVTASDYCYLMVLGREYNGFSTSPIDQKAENEEVGYSTAHTTGTTPTTTQADELVVACYVGDAVGAIYTAGTGYGNLAQGNNGAYGSLAICDKTIAATGAQSTSISSGATYVNGWGCIVTLKLAPTNNIKAVGPVTWVNIKAVGPVVVANIKKILGIDV